jgi:hypothetical protein
LVGVAEYELVVPRVGSLIPALDIRVATPGFAWTSCSFVGDASLANWQWQFGALRSGNEVIAASEPRAITFLPCRLADGSACHT